MDRITFDTMIDRTENYECVMYAGISPQEVAPQDFRVDPSHAADPVKRDLACATDFTIRGPSRNGSLSDASRLAASSCAPLTGVATLIS